MSEVADLDQSTNEAFTIRRLADFRVPGAKVDKNEDSSGWSLLAGSDAYPGGLLIACAQSGLVLISIKDAEAAAVAYADAQQRSEEPVSSLAALTEKQYRHVDLQCRPSRVTISRYGTDTFWVALGSVL